MSWIRGLLAVLALCVLPLAGTAGCGTGDANEQASVQSPSPVGKLLEDTDEEGRAFREVDEDDAPEVDIEVQPDDSGDGWDLTLTLDGFRFSPADTPARAVAGRGVARLFLDGRFIAELRTPEYRLAARLVPRGTHQVTARLYADDGTVWAADGEPIECTADITASGTEGAGE
ncbi:hypothetical protein [Streptomyces sp. B93]|uniref:hypothetical protein n=1 Tax=Streptomyces sp. B93 TaxID=2824875 RepID=UPI001B399A99|nr:hypothetical protein [Streptomyces sp. B93]MBQ1092053.1 hypothetical protein [Streptomyces sp. B93]